MEKLSHYEALNRYIFSLLISDHDFEIRKYKEIEELTDNKALYYETVKKLLYEITNYNNDPVINLMHFVNRLQLNDETKEDIRTQIFSAVINEDYIYNLYNTYVDYLGIIPKG